METIQITEYQKYHISLIIKYPRELFASLIILSEQSHDRLLKSKSNSPLSTSLKFPS